MLRSLLALPLAIVLGGCVSAETPPESPDPLKSARPVPPVESCNASQIQGLIGQPASVLNEMSLAEPFRIIKPGMAVTMDYAPERMNIHLDKNNLIESVTCG